MCRATSLVEVRVCVAARGAAGQPWIDQTLVFIGAYYVFTGDAIALGPAALNSLTHCAFLEFGSSVYDTA